MNADDLRTRRAPAVDALLHGLFDYAGLFPPAALSMAEAAENYQRYRTSADSWMLGRFVVPAARLNELADAAPAAESGAWPLSVVVRSWREETPMVEAFAAAHRNQFQVAAIETRDPARQPAFNADTFVYVELPIDDQLPHRLTALAAKERAKLRAGGLEADQFPPADEIAKFMDGCLRLMVGWKATAGLHHPFPAERPTCDADDAPLAPMHGFVNVTLAATLIYSGLGGRRKATELLEESDAGAFGLSPDAIQWRGVAIEADAIRKTRERFFHSIGSCSFDEPLDDLKSAGWL